MKLNSKSDWVNSNFKPEQSTMKFAFVFIAFFVGLFLHGAYGAPAWSWIPFRSSSSNAEIAKKSYPNSWLERNVAIGLGDEIPRMRDDLIRRKSNGQGFFKRHWKAWTTRENWKFDPNNNAKELADPYNYKG